MAVPTDQQLRNLHLGQGTLPLFRNNRNGCIRLDNCIKYLDTSTGRGQFGIADLGVGATGLVLNGTYPEPPVQAHGRINAAVASNPYSASYNTVTITAGQTNDVSVFASWNELYITGTMTLGGSNYAAVWGNLEMAAAATLTTPAGTSWMAGVTSTVQGPAGLVTGCVMAGVYVQSGIHASATIGAALAGFYVDKQSGKKAWSVGFQVAGDAATVGVQVNGGANAFVVGAIPSGTDGSCFKAGTSSTPLTMTGAGSAVNLYVDANHTSGTHRTVWVETVFGGAATPGGFAIRGYAELKTGITSGGTCYIAGVQGKVKVSGTLNGTSEGRVAALFGQLDITAGVYTAGQLSACWLDCGATAGATLTAQEFYILRMTNTTAASVNGVLYAYAKGAYFAALGEPDGGTTWHATRGTPSTTATCDGQIKVLVDGKALYIPLYNACSIT